MKHQLQQSACLALGLTSSPAWSGPLTKGASIVQTLEPSSFAVIIVCALAFAAGMIIRGRKF